MTDKPLPDDKASSEVGAWTWRPTETSDQAVAGTRLKWQIRLGPPPFPEREFGEGRMDLPSGRVWIQERLRP